MRGRDNHILLSVSHNSTIRYVAPMAVRGTHVNATCGTHAPDFHPCLIAILERATIHCIEARNHMAGRAAMAQRVDWYYFRSG